jgi:DNA-binding transcriptional MocR family regulator
LRADFVSGCANTEPQAQIAGRHLWIKLKDQWKQKRQKEKKRQKVFVFFSLFAFFASCNPIL